MDFEKFTERSRGFVQSAQGLALREGHQRFSPEHLLKVLLDDEEARHAFERGGELLGPRDISMTEATQLLRERLALPKLTYVQLPRPALEGLLTEVGFAPSLSSNYSRRSPS